MKTKQVRHSSLCRAVQDGFLLSNLPGLRLLLVKLIAETQASILLSDLPDLWLLLVKLIAETQANTCLSCPISCSTTPGVIRARRPRTSSTHIVRAHHPCTSSTCCPLIVSTSSALLPMVTGGLNYLLL